MADAVHKTSKGIKFKASAHSFGWLVVCIEDLRRFSGISAISRLGSRR